MSQDPPALREKEYSLPPLVLPSSPCGFLLPRWHGVARPVYGKAGHRASFKGVCWNR